MSTAPASADACRGTTRRRLALVAGAIGLLQISACVSAPPAPAPAPTPPASDGQQALRDLGFAATEQGWELNLSGRVTFGVDESSLSPQALASIAEVAHTLMDIGVKRITVQGHTDNQGGVAHNQALSERRAQTAAKAFVDHGFAAEAITRQGFGASRPIADNASEAGRQLNRRVTIIVTSL